MGKVKGFYFVGLFNKGIKATCSFQVAKPFQTDINGKSTGVIFRGFKRNQWVSDWEFIEDYNISDIDKIATLREMLQDVWDEWCKKHKRKFCNIFKEVKDGEY